MEAVTKRGVEEIRMYGGSARSSVWNQLFADMYGVPVLLPSTTETTALGAAYLAGLQAGVFSSMDELAERWQAAAKFEPALPASERERLLAGWHDAVARLISTPR